MINQNRVVPVEKADLLSVYYTMFAIVSENATIDGALAADNANGDFTVSVNSKVYVASEPVKSVNFAAAATAGTVYFIAGYNYEGFKLSGTATETAGVDVDADSVTLYKAVLSSGTVTISKVGA
jgi:hypothetical protein